MKAPILSLFLILAATIAGSQTTGLGPTLLQNGPTVNPKVLAQVRYADQYLKSDCGANINAADTDLGTIAGEIWVNRNCGLTISTPVTISANHTLRFIQGGTYVYSGQWTLRTATSIVGTPSSINEDILLPLANPAVVLQQAGLPSTPANLAPSFMISGENVVLQDFAIDLNARGGNTSGVGIDFNTGACSSPSCLGHFRMYDMTVENGPMDDVHVTSSSAYDQANAWVIENSTLTRAIRGSGLTVTNTTDGRLLYSNLEENFLYGIREIDSSLLAMGNDISTGSACAYITGDGNGGAVQLAGGGDIYAYNGCVPTENVSVSPSLFGGFIVQGYNGIAAPAVQNERFIANTISAGQGFITNTLDAIHMEDAGTAEIADNNFISYPGQAWRYNIYISYNHSGGARDTAIDNTYGRNFGTGDTFSNGYLYLEGNNAAGAKTSLLQNASLPNYNGSNQGGLYCKTTSGTDDLCLLMDSHNILEMRGNAKEKQIVMKPDGTTQSFISTSTTNSGFNVPIVTSLTTTASSSDRVTVTGMTGKGHCSITATNASAGNHMAATYVSAKSANQITVSHTAAAGMDYDILCTPN